MLPEKRKLLQANQARVVRLFMTSKAGQFARDKWRNQAELQDRMGIALSLQLLSQLQCHLCLDTIIGLHPRLAPSCFKTSWNNITDRKGCKDSSGCKSPLWILSKRTTAIQCREILRHMSQNNIDHWAILLPIDTQTFATRSLLQQHGSCIHRTCLV